MFEAIKNLFAMLDSQQRKQLYALQLLVLVMAFLEIAGIVSIVPFMKVVAEPSLLEKSKFFGYFYVLSGVDSPYLFLFWMGVFVLFLVFISATVSIYTTWKLLTYGSKLGMELGDSLYQYYMSQPWLFHISTNSSFLTKQITQEASRVTSQIILPLLQLNAKIVLLVFLLITIFFFEPYVAVVGFLILSLVYLTMYKYIKRKVYDNGLIITETGKKRFRLMNEGFGSIKDTILIGKQDTFVSKFSDAGNRLAKSQGMNMSLAKTPRFFVEFIAISSFIFLILYLIMTNNGNLSKILPLLSVYALAGLKLLPATQQIYAHTTTIKGALPALNAIRRDIQASKKVKETCYVLDDVEFPKRTISLNGMSFTYPSRQTPAIKHVSFEIPVNGVVGIAGASGSGKSTMIDILLGLIEPETGSICLDGIPLKSNQIRSWQDNIGYVPQNIFLLDGSIAENIAFGVDTEKIDMKKVEQVVEMVHLKEFVDELSDGVFSEIGEQGVRLSGGQRQRIGIARALYYDANLLVFDEATSALDGVTEKLIMDAIHDFSGKKTIVLIAHRLKTIEKCDIIYFMDKGSIVDSGSYFELIKRNKDFKKMALHA